MSAAIGSAGLQRAWKELHEKWGQTRTVWDDRVGQQFEEDVMTPLELQSIQTAAAINRLAQLFAVARQHCQ